MNIKHKIKQYGPKNSMKRAVKSVLRKIGIQCESYWYMVNHIDSNELSAKMARYDYSDVKELHYEDFLKGDPQVFTPKKLELIKNRLESGRYWAYGILEEDTLAYSCWINADELQYPTALNKSFPFKKHEGLIQDAYCHPSYRGNRYHSRMNLYRLHMMAKKKLHRAVVIVLIENIPAFKTHLKSGFEPIKKIFFVKIFNQSFIYEKKIS